jgi:hypothetical protein
MSLGGDVASVLSGAPCNAAAESGYVVSVPVGLVTNSFSDAIPENVNLSPRQQQLNQIALCLLSAVCNSLRQQGLIDPNETITVSNQTYGVDNHCIESSKNASPHGVASKLISIAGNDLGYTINLIGGNDGRIFIEDFLTRSEIYRQTNVMECHDNNLAEVIRNECLNLIKKSIDLMQGTMVDFPRMAPGQEFQPWGSSGKKQMGSHEAMLIENQQHMR